MSLQNHIHIQYPYNPVTITHHAHTGCYIVDITYLIPNHTFVFWALYDMHTQYNLHFTKLHYTIFVHVRIL